MNSYEIKSYEDIRDSLRVRVMDIKENAETLQNAVFEPVDDFQRSFRTDIAADKDVLEFVEKVFVNGAASGYCSFDFV